MNKQIIFDYIRKKYGTLPDYPWPKYDDNAVFRHEDNRKWFALVMEVQRDRLGLSDQGGAGSAFSETEGDRSAFVLSDTVPVINLKVDDLFFRDMIIQQDGIMPAYHMNKLHWITVLLDGTVPEKTVFDLIGMSFRATASKKKKH